ncbi:MAG TPA: hypothetical protein VE030_00375 [Burkholderiales bacterium]|nr:hypothetical protein [Burkholderiales bacterium]
MVLVYARRVVLEPSALALGPGVVHRVTGIADALRIGLFDGTC